MDAKKFIAAEFKRREDLLLDVKFREMCVDLAKKLGITAKEWNENKAVLILFFANEFCSIENKMNRK